MRGPLLCLSAFFYRIHEVTSSQSWERSVVSLTREVKENNNEKKKKDVSTSEIQQREVKERDVMT